MYILYVKEPLNGTWNKPILKEIDFFFIPCNHK